MLPRLVLRVTTLAVCGLLSVSGSQECQSLENLNLIQTVCKMENEAIVYAEGERDTLAVCRHFPAVFKCAVSALPHCYTYVESLFTTYHHSPFNCQFTQELIRELQEIYMKGTHGDKPSTPTIEEPFSSSMTQSEQMQSGSTDSTADQSSGVEDKGRSTTRHLDNGAHKELTDNNKDGAVVVVPSRLSVAVLVLAATMLWSFTS